MVFRFGKIQKSLLKELFGVRVLTQQGFKQIKGRTSRGLLGEGAAIGSCSAPTVGSGGTQAGIGQAHSIVL